MENSWILRFKTLTDNGLYAEAKELLADVHPHTLAEQRTLGHFHSQLHFYEGQYQQALDKARQTEADFGPNIRLTGDITVYLYYLDAGPFYLKALEHFKNDYFAVCDKLSSESLFWATTNLAKLLEEQGDVAASIQLYTNILKTSLNSERELRTKANLLRCYATLGQRAPIAELYRDVFHAKADKLSRFAIFEQEHALLLADLYLLGHKGAELRLKHILQNPQFDLQEKSLSYHDFLDILMMINPSASKDVAVIDLAPAPQFFFEQEIAKAHEHLVADRPLPLPDLYHLKSSRSPVDVLRILSHGARSSDKEVAEFCRLQFSLLLDSTPSASQKFWQHRLPKIHELRISLDRKLKSLHFRSRSLELKRSPKQIQLLELFSARRTWLVADLCHELYGFADDSSTYDRLRMLVKSLNENMRSLTGDVLLALDDEVVHLRDEVILEAARERKDPA